MYDVIIIGMGISGISAGIYAKQANKKVLLIEGSMIGGILNSIDKIENFAGISTISGPDFAMNLFEQVTFHNLEYKLDYVSNVIPSDDFFTINISSGDSFDCRNVVIATGRAPRLLGLDGEKELLGKGISTCALCDGNFFKGKNVAVVGAGNSALQESLYLSNIVSKVYLLMRRSVFAGSPELVDKVKSCDNIEILFSTSIKEINKDESGNFKSLTLSNDDVLDVSGLFIYAGYHPSTDEFKNLGIVNNNGYIEVDNNLQTTVDGIFAIGDVTKKDIYQLMNAAADGARVIGKLRK